MKAVRISLGGPEMQGYENTSRLALMIFYKTLPRPSLPTARLSKDFASAALSTLAEMMEPKGALGTLVKFGLAVDGSWAQIYHERVPLSLDQTTRGVNECGPQCIAVAQ